MVKELVDVVVVDVRIVAEHLMALKMRLIEEDMGVGVGMSVGMGVDMGVGMGKSMGMGRGHGHGRGCGHGRRVSNVDWQRLVDAYEDGDDYHELAAFLGIPYQMES